MFHSRIHCEKFILHLAYGSGHLINDMLGDRTIFCQKYLPIIAIEWIKHTSKQTSAYIGINSCNNLRVIYLDCRHGYFLMRCNSVEPQRYASKYLLEIFIIGFRLKQIACYNIFAELCLRSHFLRQENLSFSGKEST